MTAEEYRAKNKQQQQVGGDGGGGYIDDPNFDRKLDIITAGANAFVKEHLLTRITKENCLTIANYILAMQTEISPAQSYRIETILNLKYLAEFHRPKSFRDITRHDLVDYLDRFRKPESVDPMHRWVGTYEFARILLLRFFKWLHYPDTPHNKRPKPEMVENIPQIKRKEISTYKPTDLWTEEDDFIFHKYCPYSRDRCWHAVSRDTGCRPHELLKLKIKDVVVQQLENGYQVARITVNGKTGTRHVRLNNSYPRLKDWLCNGHPFAGNPNAPLFCGYGKKNTGRRLLPHSIAAMYDHYKKVYFPKLLEDPLVPEADRRKIRDLLKKPWNPYIRRHSAATEISKALKDPVLIDDYMGWSHKGNTRQKYQHYYADDAFDAMLAMMDGLVLPANTVKDRMKNLIKPRVCPNCNEGNKPESKFCVKCKFVLTFDAFNEAIQEREKAAKEVEEQKRALAATEKDTEELKDQLQMLRQEMSQMSERFRDMLAVASGRAYPPDTVTSATFATTFNQGQLRRDNKSHIDHNRRKRSSRSSSMR